MIKIGTRVAGPEEVGKVPVDLIQISYWKRFGPDLAGIEKAVARCREMQIPYVIHPVFTPLSEIRPDLRIKNRKELITLAQWADLGMILHDEILPDGGRLSGEHLREYRESVKLLSSYCPLSIENANNTWDIDWFWQEMGGSITLDLGHFEASGIDSVRKVRSLSEEVIARVDYVHMHHKNGERGGLVDHWPLTENCREVSALRELVQRKKDFSVILEINETDRLEESLAIIRKICR
jgi:sugar phosphate isomerase/epimerase